MKNLWGLSTSDSDGISIHSTVYKSVAWLHICMLDTSQVQSEILVPLMCNDFSLKLLLTDSMSTSFPCKCCLCTGVLSTLVWSTVWFLSMRWFTFHNTPGQSGIKDISSHQLSHSFQFLTASLLQLQIASSSLLYHYYTGQCSSKQCKGVFLSLRWANIASRHNLHSNWCME